jgi:hypothetical protein
MTETPQAPESASPPLPEPDQGGFFTREFGKILPHAERTEAEAGQVAADVKAALQDHAGTVFDVSGDVLAVLKLIDPADAPLAAAAGALLPKVLAMAEKAAALASAALKG